MKNLYTYIYCKIENRNEHTHNYGLEYCKSYSSHIKPTKTPDFPILVTNRKLISYSNVVIICCILHGTFFYNGKMNSFTHKLIHVL